MKRLILVLALFLLAPPAAAQVSPAQWDSLAATIESLPNNPPVRDRKAAALDLIARFRLIPPGTVIVVDSVLVVDTVFVTEPIPSDPEPPDTTVVSVEVTPGSGPSVLPGEAIQFAALTVDSAGIERESAVAWASSDMQVATVAPTGLATGVSPGLATITATAGDAIGSALLEVRAPDPPPGEQWDRVLADTLVQGDIVVPAGKRWLIGAGVDVLGNVLVQDATLGMRPGSTLRFLGAEPSQYVGGGMHYGPEFAADIGLWVWGAGVLDIQCTPKASWNRTGTDPTWRASDEYWIAPTDVGDYEPRRWNPGDPVPQVDPRVPAAEVLNVTRDCVIEGPAHIHVNASEPSRIEYVRLEGLGIIRGGEAVTGRYALHLHMQGEASRGTVVRGVAAVNSGGRVFVPHTSHGVTMIDNVSLNSAAEGMWWDVGDDTNDLLVDRLAVVGVFISRAELGSTPRFKGFTLGSGLNMEIRNSVASGVRMSNLSTGFDWVSGGQAPNPVWVFERGNVAHNNTGPGLRFWTNLSHDHEVSDFVSYRNGNDGIQNGAYKNSVRYADVLIVDDHILHNSNTREPPGSYTNVRVHASGGPAFFVRHRNLPSDGYHLIVDCVLEAAPGHPKVMVLAGQNPWLAHFIRSGVTPDDIEFETLTGGNDGSHILIDHEDGRRWEIRVQNGQKLVTER